MKMPKIRVIGGKRPALPMPKSTSNRNSNCKGCGQ
jgi:hypothetical protein